MRLLSSALSLLLIAGSLFPNARKASELQALFVPPHAPPGTYDVFVSDETIDALARRLRATGSSWPDGAWTIEQIYALDAFGSDGRYDRYRLARLFSATRPRVARGPLVRDGRALGSVTLISPYPDPAMTRLMSGTLVILTFVQGS